MKYDRNYAMTMASMRGFIAGLVDSLPYRADIFPQEVKAAVVYFWAVKEYEHEQACLDTINLIRFRVDSDAAGHRIKTRVQRYPDGELYVYAASPVGAHFFGPYRDEDLTQTVVRFLGMESVAAFERLTFDNMLKRIDANMPA